MAISPDNDGLIQVYIADLHKRIPPKQFMQQRIRLKNLRQGSTLDTADLDGYTAIADSNTTFGVRAVRYAVIYRNNSAYIFACAAKNTKNPRIFDTAMLATACSFRSLTAADEPYAREKKIAVIRVPRGTSYANLVAESPLTDYPETQLRLLNAAFPDGEPEAAQLIKVIH